VRGISNVGVRPTVNGRLPVLEVHLFDWQEEIYGQLMQVEFLHFLRPEKRFEGLEALKTQIFLDIETARRWFEHTPEQHSQAEVN